MEAQAQPKVVRGNLGLCHLDMSLVNICGVPSLWMDPKSFSQSGAIISMIDSKGSEKAVFEPYI
jgi:hypothetical protein